MFLYCHLMSRFVIIDDTDPSIRYSGPWFEATNNTLPQTVSVGGSYNGPPFQNTLHGVNVAASLSFNFNGMLVLITFTDSNLLSSLSHSIVVFRIGSHCLRDKHNNECFWGPRSNLGVFYRQYQHRFVSSQQCGTTFF